MRRHKSHALAALCQKGVDLPAWPDLASGDGASTPPPEGAHPRESAARALARIRNDLVDEDAAPLEAEVLDDALRALVALLLKRLPDEKGDGGASAAAAAAGGCAVLGEPGLGRMLADAKLPAADDAAARTAHRRMRVAAGIDDPLCCNCGEPRPKEPPACEWAYPCAQCAEALAKDTDATIDL